MFVYLFTIEGYNVIATIEFFPHVIVLEDSSPKLVDDDSELCFILSLGYFTAEIFTTGLFLYCSILLLC